MLWRLLVLVVLIGCSDEASTPAVRVSEMAEAEAPVRFVAEDLSDAPLAGLTDEELARFEDGDARFEMPFQEAQGLGPLFIARSCTGCHEDDARGPGVVRRIVSVGHLPYGDTVRPRMTAGARTPLLAPEGAREAIRVPSAIFARGLIEAIPDATLLAYEAAQVGDAELSGRAARIAPETTPTTFGEGRPRIGRFGHKARSASLDAFIADALLGDMGLTSPSRPTELPTPDGLDDDRRPGIDVGEDVVALLADYVRGVAMPRRDLAGHEAGEALFARVGCERCHASDARTRADHPVAALRDIDAAIYSDLLLHDMGEGLSDGIAEGEASAREWRTAPLIGVRHLRGLLHDGRAATVREAIAQHASEGSEANATLARFHRLGPTERDALVAFVEAL